MATRFHSPVMPAPGMYDLNQEPVGVIFGNVGTTEFRLAVSDPGLQRLDYVRVELAGEGWVLAQIADVTRESSLNIEDATRMASGALHVHENKLLADARVVGYRDANGHLVAPRVPLASGAFVFRAEAELVANVFGLDSEREGAFIGFLRGYRLPVHLDLNLLVQKHVSVLAKTGSGKSYVVGVLMEEIIKRGIPIVIIDPHGEHGSLATPNTARNDARAMQEFGVRPRGYAERVIEMSPSPELVPGAVPLRLGGANMTAQEIAEALPGKVSNAQMGLLHQATRALADRGEAYSLAEVIEEVRNGPSASKWNLLTALEYLDGLGLFADKGTAVEALVHRNKVTVINLKGVAPDVQEVVVAQLASRLFEARKLGTIPPFMLVMEEAHNFCPERGLNNALSGEILRTVASEGRKFGLGLMVVSQRPAKVDKNVLSQCNTQIMLKVTNPQDLKALGASVEGLTRDVEDELQRLPVGVALVSHPRFTIPIMVAVRPRETQHGGESVDVLGAAQIPVEALPGARKGDAALDDAHLGDQDAEAASPEEDEPFTLSSPPRAGGAQRASRAPPGPPGPTAPGSRASPVSTPPLSGPPPSAVAPDSAKLVSRGGPPASPRSATPSSSGMRSYPPIVEEVRRALPVVRDSDVTRLSRKQIELLLVDLGRYKRALGDMETVDPDLTRLERALDAELVRVMEGLARFTKRRSVFARVFKAREK